MDNQGLSKPKPPIYEPLLLRIRRAIESKEYLPGQHIGSEKQLADKGGISRVSVRRAVTQLISEGLIERRPGKGLYVRSPEQTTQFVQIVVPSLMHDHWIKIVQGAQTVASDRGTQVLVADAHANIDQVVEIIHKLPRMPVRGAILPGLVHPRYLQVLLELRAQRYPFVLIAPPIEGVDISSVTADNRQGGYLAGKQLLRLGHRRIGFIGAAGIWSDQQRVDGLRDALNDSGVALDRQLTQSLEVDELGDWEPALAKCIGHLLDLPERPTAIFFANDELAAMAYHILRERGIRVPEDLSVVGFDNNSLCKWLDPPLTTIAQPSETLGHYAMQMLIDRLSGTTTPMQTIRHTLPVTWLMRKSVKDISGVSAALAQ